MTSSQNTDWESNLYVLTTTRILGVFGVTYLIKVSYQLYKTMKASDERAVVSGRMIEAEEDTLGLELGLDGLLSEDSAGFSIVVMTSIDEAVGIRPPPLVHYSNVQRPGLIVSTEDDSDVLTDDT